VVHSVSLIGCLINRVGGLQANGEQKYVGSAKTAVTCQTLAKVEAWQNSVVTISDYCKRCKRCQKCLPALGKLIAYAG
jgi:hypothetical protein